MVKKFIGLILLGTSVCFGYIIIHEISGLPKILLFLPDIGILMGCGLIISLFCMIVFAFLAFLLLNSKFSKQLLENKIEINRWENWKTPESAYCLKCGKEIKFKKWISHKRDKKDFEYYHFGSCTSSGNHFWIWNQKSGWLLFSDKKWEALTNSPWFHSSGTNSGSPPG